MYKNVLINVAVLEKNIKCSIFKEILWLGLKSGIPLESHIYKKAESTVCIPKKLNLYQIHKIIEEYQI